MFYHMRTQSKLYEQEAVALLKDAVDLITDSENALSNFLSYPLYETLSRYIFNLSMLIQFKTCLNSLKKCFRHFINTDIVVIVLTEGRPILFFAGNGQKNHVFVIDN